MAQSCRGSLTPLFEDEMLRPTVSNWIMTGDSACLWCFLPLRPSSPWHCYYLSEESGDLGGSIGELTAQGLVRSMEMG